MRLLLLDNYDSFTYNVAGLFHELEVGVEVEVIRNDAASVAELLALGHDSIVISPGPGGPVDAGVSMELIATAGERRIPLLGVCLGMQSIAQVFGATVTRLAGVVHGSATPVAHDDAGVFAGMPQGFAAGRYHSLVVDAATLGNTLVATAHTDGGVLMGLRHATLPIEGVQFHPESILTPEGAGIARAFVDMVERTRTVDVQEAMA